MTRRKRILIIDDHPIFRTGLKHIIENDGRYAVVGEAGTAQEGFCLAKRLRPDIAVVDLMLPDFGGALLIRRLSDEVRGVRSVVVSARSENCCITGAVQAGAMGYVIKGSGAGCVLKCLEVVSGGKRFIDNSLSDSLCELFISSGTSAKESAGPLRKYGELTRREQEVMELIGRYPSVKDIAEKLAISPNTVKNHQANIMKKIGVSNKVQLIQYAALKNDKS